MEKQIFFIMKKSTASKTITTQTGGVKNAAFKAVQKKSSHSRISDSPRKSSTGGLNHAISSKKGK